MNRRDALRALVFGAGAAFAGAGPTIAWHRADGRDRIAALLRSLSRNRVHVIFADPNVNPSYVRDPMVELLQADGEPVRLPQLDRPSNPVRGVLLLDQPDLPVRRFWLELRKLDRRARRGEGMVLATWQRQSTRVTDWISWFGGVTGSVIRAREREFDEPPEVIPSRYRVPVEVFRGGRLRATISLVEAIAHRG